MRLCVDAHFHEAEKFSFDPGSVHLSGKCHIPRSTPRDTRLRLPCSERNLYDVRFCGHVRAIFQPAKCEMMRKEITQNFTELVCTFGQFLDLRGSGELNPRRVLGFAALFVFACLQARAQIGRVKL